MPSRRQRDFRPNSTRHFGAKVAVGLMALLSLLGLSFGVSAQLESKALAFQTFRKTDRVKSEFVSGEILVRFRRDALAAGGQRFTKEVRANGRDMVVNVESFEGSALVEGLRLVRVHPEETVAAIEALNAQPDVLYAEPNYIWRRGDMPNDPRYGEQWALKNTGQLGFNDYTGQQAPGTVGADIDAEPAWTITKGSSSVVVGVIDGGVDVNHEDLRDNIWVNPGETAGDSIDNDGNGLIDDVNGWDFTPCVSSSPMGCGNNTVFDNQDGDDHGTHVAGTIGAEGNNGVGVVGVNWDVRIMSLKVLGPNGGSTSNIIRGYNYARMMRERGINIRVLNNSYGGAGNSQAALDAINELNQAGILFVAAAGNEATDNFAVPHYPSNYDAPNIIGVAATDRFDQIAIFSNFGARIVSIGAPGRGILSTVPPGMQIPNLPAGATYAFFSGTSMATPHVAGAAALVLAANPNLTVQQVRGILAYSGDVIPSLLEKTTTGRRLNVYRSVLSAQENDTTAPAAADNLKITSQSGRTVTLSWIAPGDDGNSGTASDYNFFFTNPTTGAKILLPTTLLPAAAGTLQSATVALPYLNFSGTIELRTYDNAGNTSTASVPITIGVDSGSDPYIVSLSDASPLSTGGTPLALKGDDQYRENYSLPFDFPFYGQPRNSLTISTNGALYFSAPPKRPFGDAAEIADDAVSSIAGLNGQIMISGMWDDLRTDKPGGDVFVEQPDPNRIIFRWGGVTFNTPLPGGTTRGENPINFEIELRRDGTIVMRYGAGQSAPINTRLFSVVGISNGEPEAYVIASHTYELPNSKDLTNAQTVTFTLRPPSLPASATVQFDQSNYSLNESSNFATINVTRTGDTSGGATVDYATADGTASERRDYTTALGTLRFAPGETARSFDVLISEDSFVEGAESFTVNLSNPSGTGLGAPSTATVQITDDLTKPATNVIDDAQNFVDQHYHDFLNRQADPSGFAFWTNQITSCGGDAGCVDVKRINVSAAFFLSIEFQQTGYLVIRIYKSTFPDSPQHPRGYPRYREFLRDTQEIGRGVVVGQGNWELQLQQNKLDFAHRWVRRTDFLAQFPEGMSAAAYVDQLLSISGVTPTQSERNAAIAAYGIGDTEGRAQALLSVSNSSSVSNKHFNAGFVLMQYLGYLRRMPDQPPDNNFDGFDFWLNKLNQFNGDFQKAEMVKAFLVAGEFRGRFGP